MRYKEFSHKAFLVKQMKIFIWKPCEIMTDVIDLCIAPNHL